jgi:AcrR family transcriptional regulator
MTKSKRSTRLEPRKLPEQSRSAATVTAVLEAAARILEKDGFEGYTTNAVAERAGVSIGSLYQYFPNKDALTMALIERESAVLLSEIALTDSMEDSQAALLHLIRAAVGHQMRRPKLARLLDFEESRLPIRRRNQRVAEVVHRAILRALGCRTLDGLDTKGNAEVVALDVLAIVKGMVDAAGERGETEPAPLEQRVCRAVFGYLNRH